MRKAMPPIRRRCIHKLLLQFILLYFRLFNWALIFTKIIKKRASASSLLDFPWHQTNKLQYTQEKQYDFLYWANVCLVFVACGTKKGQFPLFLSCKNNILKKFIIHPDESTYQTLSLKKVSNSIHTLGETVPWSIISYCRTVLILFL